MRKWVIKQPTKNAPLEVWEYIDTVKEAMQYWYVAKAIRERGAENVLPIAMNANGGYHSLPADSKEIVRIVESEKKPNLSMYEYL